MNSLSTGNPNLPSSTMGFLNQEDIQFFHQQGYFIQKKAVKEEELACLDKMTDAMIKTIKTEIISEKYQISDQQQITYINGSQVVFKKYASNKITILRVVGCGGLEPHVLKTLRSHQMAMTFFDLLRCNDLEHIICSFHPKEPNDGVAFVKHRDIQYRKQFDPDWDDLLGNGSYAICFLAIDAMSSANGGLYIDKSTFPPSDKKAENAESTSPEDIKSLTMEPGDLLFMHPELLHWSDANVSEVGRRALLTGFCAWGANHKTYPGAAVNVHLTRKENSVESEPSNWDQKGTTQTINH